MKWPLLAVGVMFVFMVSSASAMRVFIGQAEPITDDMAKVSLNGGSAEVKVAEPNSELIVSAAESQTRVIYEGTIWGNIPDGSGRVLESFETTRADYEDLSVMRAFESYETTRGDQEGKADIIVEFAVSDPDDITKADSSGRIAESFESTTRGDSEGYLISFRTTESDETQRGDIEGYVIEFRTPPEPDYEEIVI